MENYLIEILLTGCGDVLPISIDLMRVASVILMPKLVIDESVMRKQLCKKIFCKNNHTAYCGLEYLLYLSGVTCSTVKNKRDLLKVYK